MVEGSALATDCQPSAGTGVVTRTGRPCHRMSQARTGACVVPLGRAPLRGTVIVPETPPGSSCRDAVMEIGAKLVNWQIKDARCRRKFTRVRPKICATAEMPEILRYGPRR